MSNSDAIRVSRAGTISEAEDRERPHRRNSQTTNDNRQAARDEYRAQKRAI